MDEERQRNRRKQERKREKRGENIKVGETGGRLLREILKREDNRFPVGGEEALVSRPSSDREDLFRFRHATRLSMQPVGRFVVCTSPNAPSRRVATESHREVRRIRPTASACSRLLLSTRSAVRSPSPCPFLLSRVVFCRESTLSREGKKQNERETNESEERREWEAALTGHSLELPA